MCPAAWSTIAKSGWRKRGVDSAPDNLNRDEGKHILKSRHKRKLLMELAADFWKSAAHKWQIDHLNDWFCEWLEKNRPLADQYRRQEGEVLEKDLRNSTLLVRFDDKNFGFSHSSMQEYFLSKYLLEQWQINEQFKLDPPISRLTRRFMLDNIELMNEKEKSQLRRAIGQTLLRPYSAASELGLDIIGKLAFKGLDPLEYKVIDLRGAKLSGKVIRGLHTNKLLLDRIDGHYTSWYHCNFTSVEIDQGNISESLWHNCSWETLNCHQTDGAFLEGVTLADCRIETNAKKPLLPSKHCFSAHSPTYRKTGPENPDLKNWQFSHSGTILSCGFSPDGKRIISGSDDNSLKLWDLKGNCIQTFEGHNSPVWSCGFSPDGKKILSGSWDSAIRIWDIASRALIYLYSSSQDQWYSAEFHNNQLIMIKGTELSWRLANLARDGNTWSLDELECFSYRPGFLASRERR
jgi:hypothetical protein